MNAQAPRTVAVSLKVEDLLEKVVRGEVRIPPFQRPLRWKHEDNRLLLESVFLGYPVGALLFWERRGEPERLHIGPMVIDAPLNERTWWIVDGQQRITALVGGLAASQEAAEKTFRFWLNLELEKIESTGGPLSVPLGVLGDSERLLHWLDRWPVRSEHPELVKRAVSASKKREESSFLFESWARIFRAR